VPKDDLPQQLALTSLKEIVASWQKNVNFKDAISSYKKSKRFYGILYTMDSITLYAIFVIKNS